MWLTPLPAHSPRLLQAVPELTASQGLHCCFSDPVQPEMAECALGTPVDPAHRLTGPFHVLVIHSVSTGQRLGTRYSERRKKGVLVEKALLDWQKG